MSLESVISDLVTESKNLVSYFTSKKKGIDDAVAAAIVALPETTRSWYVDQVNGSDSNAGNMQSAPFKTFQKALNSTPNSGQCNVFLLGDYTMDVGILVNVAYLMIYGFNAVASGITPKIKPKYIQQTDATSGVVTTSLAGFTHYSQSANIEIRSCDLVLPSPAGLNPAPSSTRLCSFIKTNAGSGLPPMLGVMLQSMTVTKSADFYGCLIGITASSLALGCVNTTFPSDFSGKYVSTVPAGADVKTISAISTNLGSL